MHTIYSTETISKLVQRNMVLVWTCSHISQIKEKYSQYKLYQSADDNSLMYMHSFIIRKNIDTNIKRKFIKLLKQIYSLGIDDAYNKKLLIYYTMINHFEHHRKYPCIVEQSENVNYVNLNLNQLFFIFTILSFWLLISIFSFMIEILYKLSSLKIFC